MRQQRTACTVLYLRLETTSAERAFDTAVGKEQRLGALLLRAGTFDAGDNPQREGLPFRQRILYKVVKPGHKQQFLNRQNVMPRPRNVERSVRRGSMRCGAPVELERDANV